MMKYLKTHLLAWSVAAAGSLPSHGNTNLDAVLKEGSHWQKSAALAAKDFSDLNWESKDGMFALKDDDLKLWNRDVRGFSMKSSHGKLRLLKVEVLETPSKADFTEALATWKAVMTSRLDEEARESAYRSEQGGVLSLKWRKEAYLVSLKGEEKGETYSLSLNYRPINAPPASVASEKDKYDGIYERTFYSPDYRKSFRGVVQSYDEGSGTLKIEKGNSVTSVNLDHLSDRDADYIDRVSGMIAAKNGLRLQITEQKGKPQKNARAIAVDTHFDITLVNNSKSNIDDVEIRYDMFHKVDTLNGGPVLKKTSGSIKLGEVFAQYRETSSTKSVGIVRESRPGMGGG